MLLGTESFRLRPPRVDIVVVSAFQCLQLVASRAAAAAADLPVPLFSSFQSIPLLLILL